MLTFDREHRICPQCRFPHLPLADAKCPQCGCWTKATSEEREAALKKQED